MARKVGQIIARGDRRWLIRVYLGRDHETKKRNYHYRTIHGGMREAQAYLTRKLRERDLGGDLEGAKITLNEYVDRWLKTAVGPRVRPNTFQDYQGMLHRYVRPVLGERILAALRPLDLQAMYQHMTERGLSARTIRYAHVLMKGAMQQAVRWRLLLEIPADGLKVPQQVRNEMRSLTIEQARALLKAAEGTKYGPVLAVALTTGMRPSEYLGLKWQDIDWARQTVSVVRSIRRLNGKWCFSDTKRLRSRRPIKLQSWIVSLLHDLCTKVSAQDLYPEARPLIFRTPSGQPISADYLAQHFRSILDSYDLWLDPGMHAVVAISELVKPYEANAMRSYPVSTRINHVANDDEECSRPVVIAAAQNRLFLWKSVMCVARETIHRRAGKWNT